VLHIAIKLNLDSYWWGFKSILHC